MALVLGLHLTVIRLLLATAPQTTKEAKSKALDVVFYPPPTPSIESKADVRIAARVTPVHRSKHSVAPLTDVGPKSSESNGMPAPVDWDNELIRTARDTASDGSMQKSRDFGFPHRPAAPAVNPPQFGWDSIATHRVEPIPEGGLLIHLNDHCVLVLIPFPLAGCGIGKRKANGHLFDHMHDLSLPADENQPQR